VFLEERFRFGIERLILSCRRIRAGKQPGLKSGELREGELLGARVGAEN
jgi:hypothetical protein